MGLSMECDSALPTNGDAVARVVGAPSHLGAARILKEETRHVYGICDFMGPCSLSRTIVHNVHE